MPEYSQQQVDYAKYRLERSQEDLQCAEKLFNDGHFRAANNRAYYAIFHAIRAALALKSVDSSKHSGVISEFRKIYIKSGSIPAEVSQMIGAAFTIRNASDYDDMFIASVKVNIKLLFFGGVKCRFWANQSSPYHQTAACL